MKRKIKLLFIAISICAMLFAFAISSSAWSEHPTEYGTGYAVLMTSDNEYVAYVWRNNESNPSVSVDFSMDLSNIRSYTLSNNFTDIYTDEEIFTFIEEYIASVKASMTEGMFTQDDVDSAVDEAVAKALADAGLAMTSDIFIFPLNDNIPDSYIYETVMSSTASFYWCVFENYSIGIVEYADSSSVEEPWIYIVDGARAFYEDITNNVETKTVDNIYSYLDSKQEYSLDSWAYYHCVELYNAVGASLVEVPSADDLQAKYDEGKVAGVTEYKSSEEYATALNNKYSAGYTEGIESFKSSEEYTTALNSKYNDGFVAGTAEGALAYTKSDAYKTALADKYDEGYDDGFVEGEAQFDIAPFIGVISIMALISIGIVIVCWVRKKRIG